MGYDGSLKFDTEINEKGFNSGLSKMGSLAQTALGVFSGQMMTRAVDGIANLGKSALEAVSSMEQNIGGVETLFKDSAQAVIDSANIAYKTDRSRYKIRKEGPDTNVSVPLFVWKQMRPARLPSPYPTSISYKILVTL